MSVDLTTDVAAASARYIHAVEESIEKVLSKMGISTLQSYRGGKLFEAIGLSTAFVAEFFPGTASRLGGIDLDVVAEEAARRHHDAYTRQSALAGDLGYASVRTYIASVNLIFHSENTDAARAAHRTAASPQRSALSAMRARNSE